MNSYEKDPVDLKPVRSYQGWLQSIARLFVAGSLMDAAHDNEQLRKELPLVVSNYSHLLKAYRRLGTVARLQEMGKLDAYVVFFDNKITGLATIEPHQPVHLVEVEGKGAEISYWHSPQPMPIAYKIGKSVVEQLVMPARNIGMTPWMVTLPHDQIKSAINEACGFVRFGPTGLYDINDNVSAARQLWIPEGANAVDLTR